MLERAIELIDSMPSSLTRLYLFRHVLERLGKALLNEGKLANGPDLGVLKTRVSVSCRDRQLHTIKAHTGFRFFLISLSRVPALRAMISGAASGSWAMGLPHSGQNSLQTELPEEPLPSHFFTGPLMVSLSLGTTATRAAEESVVRFMVE